MLQHIQLNVTHNNYHNKGKNYMNSIDAEKIFHKINTFQDKLFQQINYRCGLDQHS